MKYNFSGTFAIVYLPGSASENPLFVIDNFKIPQSKQLEVYVMYTCELPT